MIRDDDGPGAAAASDGDGAGPWAGAGPGAGAGAARTGLASSLEVSAPPSGPGKGRLPAKAWRGRTHRG